MQVQNVPIGEVKPYKRNPRKNDGAVDAVAASIREFGFQQPIVCDMDGVVIVGHTRLKAAAKLGLKTVPVVYADLPEDKVKAYRLADNKTGELAQWDLTLLGIELADIDMDMTEFGFDNPMEEPEEVVEDDYEVVLPEEPKAKLGDIYQLGRHRLMCGDSTAPDAVSALLDGAVIDLVVTDPPYNMGYQGAGKTKDRKSKKIMNDNLSSGNFRRFLRSVYENYCANMRGGRLSMCSIKSSERASLLLPCGTAG